MREGGAVMEEALRARLAGVLAHRPGQPARQLLGTPVELTGGWAVTSVYACSLVTTAPATPAGSSHIQAPTEGRTETRTETPTEAVLKLYGPDAAGRQHAAREWRALRHLAGSPCRVPAVLDVEEDPAVLGRPFLLMQRVPGRSFWSAYEAAGEPAGAAGNADAAGAEARAGLVGAFVQPLVALHALDAAQLDPAAAQAGGGAALDAELAGLVRDVAEVGDVAAVHARGLGQVVAWLGKRRGAVVCGPAVVLHRDYHPWNAILDAGADIGADADGHAGADGRVWVLDWDWGVGDTRFDVAWTRTLLARSGHDAFADAVSAEYERRSGRVLVDLGYFEVLATVRWLLNVLQALTPGSGFDDVKRQAFAAFLVGPLQRAQELLGQRTGLAVRLGP